MARRVRSSCFSETPARRRNARTSASSGSSSRAQSQSRTDSIGTDATSPSGVSSRAFARRDPRMPRKRNSRSTRKPKDSGPAVAHERLDVVVACLRRLGLDAQPVGRGLHPQLDLLEVRWRRTRPGDSRPCPGRSRRAPSLPSGARPAATRARTPPMAPGSCASCSPAMRVSGRNLLPSPGHADSSPPAHPSLSRPPSSHTPPPAGSAPQRLSRAARRRRGARHTGRCRPRSGRLAARSRPGGRARAPRRDRTTSVCRTSWVT